MDHHFKSIKYKIFVRGRGLIVYIQISKQYLHSPSLLRALNIEYL